MILVTTTPSVDGYTITNYQGIVFGEVVSGVNMFKDLGAGCVTCSAAAARAMRKTDARP